MYFRIATLVALLKMERILHFTPGFKYGGIETLLLGLYREIDRERFQFDFIVDDPTERPEFDEIRDLGGQVYPLGRCLKRPLQYHKHLSDLLRSFQPARTTLHVHDPVRGLSALFLARRHGIENRVIHSHNDSLAGSRLPALSQVLVKFSNRLASRHFACSREAGDFLFGSRHFDIFRNAVHLDQFVFDAEQRRRVRDARGIDSEAIVIGHTGRFTDQKNHDWIIAVFCEFLALEPRACLMLVGEGPLEARIRDRCSTLGLADRVIFTGKQSDIQAYLSAMDAFLMPSHFEGLGISLVEAQAAGLPSLVSDVFPEDVFSTDAVERMSLSQPADEWAWKLLEIIRRGRFDSAEQISKLRMSGYDIRQEWRTLLRLYGYENITKLGRGR